MAQIWKENTENIMTIFADESAAVSVFYKKRGSTVSMTAVSAEPIYMGDDIWELTTAFPAGDYVIRLIIDDLVFNYRLLVLSEIDYYNDYSRPKFIEGD